MTQTHRLTAVMIVTTAMLCGCSFSRQLMPLVGEDERALAFSGPNRSNLDRTAAVMAFEQFVTAVRDNDAQGCVARLGPASLALLKGQATAAGVGPVEFWRRGDVPGLVLPGTGRPLSALNGRTTVAEIGRFNPSHREVLLLANVEGAGETRIKASFNGRDWVFEFVDSVPDAPR